MLHVNDRPTSMYRWCYLVNERPTGIQFYQLLLNRTTVKPKVKAILIFNDGTFWQPWMLGRVLREPLYLTEMSGLHSSEGRNNHNTSPCESTLHRKFCNEMTLLNIKPIIILRFWEFRSFMCEKSRSIEHVIYLGVVLNKHPFKLQKSI